MRPMDKVICVPGAGRHSSNRVKLWNPAWKDGVDPLVEWRRALGLPIDASFKQIVDAGSIDGWNLPNAVPLRTTSPGYYNYDGDYKPRHEHDLPDTNVEELGEESASLSMWVRARCTHDLYASWFAPAFSEKWVHHEIVLVLPPNWSLRCTPRV